MEKIKVLDHGYLGLVESWGSDERIIEAARMSVDKGFQGWGEEPYYRCGTCGYRVSESLIPKEHGMLRCPSTLVSCQSTMLTYIVPPAGDEKLLKYLYDHKHATPFEMAGLVIEVEAPIMVFREWHRHRTQSYNEMSARYTPLPNKNYLPTVERCLVVNATNKQAGKVKGAAELTHGSVLEWLDDLGKAYLYAQAAYESGLERGIPKELARLCVPVGRYSRMRACANLRNWLAFLTLRMDSAAQYEIRVFADALGTIIEQKFPRAWDLFAASRKP